MRNFKKILAALLCVMMVLPLAVTGVFAEEPQDNGPYTVMFNANGGQMTSNAVFQIYKGQKWVDVIGTMPTAVKEGYTLDSWYNEKYGYTLSLADTEVYMIDEGCVFIAIWKQGGGSNPSNPGDPIGSGQWVLTFDPNGGTMVGATQYRINTGDFYKDVFGGQMPQATREGYTLSGWFNEKYSYTLSIADTEYFAISEDATFKAQWAQGSSNPGGGDAPGESPIYGSGNYVMTFDANGGLLDGFTKVHYRINNGQTYASAVGSNSIPLPYREGYTFAGWSYEGWYTLSSMDETYGLTSDGTFVAMWNAGGNESPIYGTGAYVMTFDCNGGLLDNYSKVHYRINNGQTYASATGLNEIPVPVREGYTFAGWQYEGWFTLTSMQETYGLTSDGTFVAQWTYNGGSGAGESPVFGSGAYVMTWDANGGLIEGYTKYNVRINHGESYKDATGWSSVPVPTREGYNFDGWFYEPINYQLNNMDETYGLNENGTFTAHWSEASSQPSQYDYVMTWDANGGTVLGEPYLQFGVNYGMTYKEATGWNKIPSAVKEGYTFAYWEYLPISYILNNLDESYGLHENGTFTARYYDAQGNLAPVEEPTPVDYVITFDPGEGTMVGPTTYIIHKGDAYIDVFGGMPQATREGYIFGGWYNEKYNYTLSVAPTEVYMIEEDATFTAIWEEEEVTTWIVDFVTNGGTPVATQYVNDGEYIVAEAAVTTRNGYEFIGWYTDSNFDEEFDIENDPVTSDLTLYADWEEIDEPEPEGHEWDTHLLDMIIYDAEDITLIRFAKGNLTTVNAIKYGEGFTTLNQRVITANTDEDGTFTYAMREATTYSFALTLDDGTVEIISGVDFSNMTPEIDNSEKNLNITVNGLTSDVFDLWIARGTLEFYQDVKNPENMIARVKDRLEGLTSFTYTLPVSALDENGDYTVYIRYTAESGKGPVVLYFHKDVPIPEISVNGLQVTVGNLDDIKVIRVAKGIYATSGEVKRAPGCKNLTGKDVLKNKEEYTVQLKDSGTYTFAIEYNGGYLEIHTIEIEAHQASLTQNGSTVILGNLVGMQNARYAKGNYTTTAQIKAAAGAVFITPAKINDDGNIVISGLAKGEYTFAVQFTDLSVSIFHVTVS